MNNKIKTTLFKTILLGFFSFILIQPLNAETNCETGTAHTGERYTHCTCAGPNEHYCDDLFKECDDNGGLYDESTKDDGSVFGSCYYYF